MSGLGCINGLMIKPSPAGSGLAGYFAEAMEAFGPFEPEVQLAVAVSGGADSMALALLADRWARAKGGAPASVLPISPSIKRTASRASSGGNRWAWC